MVIPVVVKYDLDSVATLYKNVRTSILNMLIFYFLITNFDVI